MTCAWAWPAGSTGAGRRARGAAPRRWQAARVLVELVLEQQSRYWRRRAEVAEAPEPGGLLELDVPGFAAEVVGVSETDAATGASLVVLLRLAAAGPGLAARLHEGGWQRLV